MTVSTAEQQARLATLAAAIRTTRRPKPPPSTWTPEQQQRHRTTLVHALDGTEWHQPIPPRPRKATR
ncbi:hypothetical protein [Streptomyces virginiae]|uniref:hypothetical protein n=1 Tax=Streptomyces virginiae TaxID=1961 RepID=UPI00378D6F97